MQIFQYRDCCRLRLATDYQLRASKQICTPRPPGGQRIGRQPWDPAGHADNGARSRQGIAAGLDRFREEDTALSGTRTMTGRDLLSGSSFLFAAGDPGGPGGRWSGWGQAAALRFDGAEGAGGDGLIGLFGADYERGPLLAGVALSGGAGQGAWTAGGRYGMDAALTGMHPYLRLALTDRFSVWGTVGYGAGEMTVTDGGGEGPSRGWRTGIGMSILALGAGGALLKPEVGLLGQQAETALARAGITSNKNPLPFDARSPSKWTGLRLGVSAATTRGFGTADMEVLGECIADLLHAEARSDPGPALARAGARIARLAQGAGKCGPG